MDVLRHLQLSVLVLAIAASDFAGAAERADQSTGGKDSYDRYCVDCHHVTLRGTGHGPPLNGAQFREHWASKPPAELAHFIQTAMSSTMPASTSSSVYADIAAYLLQSNGIAHRRNNPDCARRLASSLASARAASRKLRPAPAVGQTVRLGRCHRSPMQCCALPPTASG